jgi:hypothetical protein
MDPTIEFCNELVSKPESESFRDARMINISQRTYDSLITNHNVGVASIYGYGGGMYTGWYLFRKSDEDIYFIFRSFSKNDFHWTWRKTNDQLDDIELEIQSTS